MIHVRELLPDADNLVEANGERLAEQTADKLRQEPGLRRAAVMEPDGRDYLVGVAVPIPGCVATAVLRVPDADPFELLACFDQVCDAQAAHRRAEAAGAKGRAVAATGRALQAAPSDAREKGAG